MARTLKLSGTGRSATGGSDSCGRPQPGGPRCRPLHARRDNRCFAGTHVRVCGSPQNRVFALQPSRRINKSGARIPIRAPAPRTRRPVRGEVLSHRRLFVGRNWRACLNNPERIRVRAPELMDWRRYFPVPESCTVWVPAASLILKVAERAPVAAGVNVTVIVQSQPALRLVPHVDFSAKSPGSVPPSV